MNPEAPYNELPKLPPQKNIETPHILKKVIHAYKKLGELRESGPLIPNQVLLLQLIGLKEAKLSSEIENVVTTNDELYKAFADRTPYITAETKEVLRYKDALWFGYDAITKKKRLLNTVLFEEIVAILLDADTGIRKLPGTKLINPYGQVIYSPPEGEDLIREKLAHLEKFIYEETELDQLIKLALIHYQFEAIHPFYDGNGRTGRIINILFLIEKNLLVFPILYHSQYIIQNKSLYYQLLKNVTEKQEWEAWIFFILETIIQTAEETRKKILDIQKVMEKTKKKIQSKLPKIYSETLLEILFTHPYCKIKFLEREGVAKRQTASNYLQQLTKIGILECIQNGKEKYFLNRPFIEVLTK